MNNNKHYKMKHLLIISLFFSTPLFSQGYVNLGSSALIKNGSNHSLAIGAGAKFDNLSAGITTDIYGVGKSKSYQFAMAALDLRYYHSNFFLSAQPGWIGYNRKTHDTHVKGSFAGAAMLGYNYKFLEISAGYQYTSFKSLVGVTEASQVKVNLSFTFGD